MSHKKPIVEFLDWKKEADAAVKRRLDFHEHLLYAVLGIVGAGFTVMIIAVFAIFIQYARDTNDQYIRYISELRSAQMLVIDTRKAALEEEINLLKVRIEQLKNN